MERQRSSAHLAAIVAAATAVWATGLSSSGSAAEAPPARGLDLITNGGFELDWFNTRAEVMSCPVLPRAPFGQADGIPDGWDLAGCARVGSAHSGRCAVSVPPGKALAQVNIAYAVHVKAAFAAAPLSLSAWTMGTGPNDSVVVTVLLKGLDIGPILTVERTFPCPTKWTPISLDIAAEKIAAALDEKTKDKVAGCLFLELTFKPGPNSLAVLVDDVRLDRPYVPAPYTLVPNAGFEKLGKDGLPVEWSSARKSLRHIGSWYYVWRSWYHFMGVPRGANAVDEVVVATGKHSFRMNVPPGDEKYIESAPIALNQAAPQRMALRFDYNAYLLANLYVQVIDDRGREVCFDVRSPGTTGGWRSYLVEFVPKPIKANAGYAGVGPAAIAGDAIPVKSCTVRIGARGVNGSSHDDINQWINVNHAGVLWIDNVSLMEMDNAPEQIEVRGAKVFEADKELPDLLVESIDLGERLYGENTASVTMMRLKRGTVSGTVSMSLTGPYREDDPRKAGYAMGVPDQDKLEPPVPKAPAQKASAKFKLQAGERTTVQLPYTLAQLVPDWRSEYRMSIALDERHRTELTLGTWSQQVLVEVEKCYLYPDETEETVSLNFGVARPMLDRTRALHVEIRRAKDDSVVQQTDVADFATLAAKFNLSPLPEGWQGDNTNFLQLALDVSRLPVHPQTCPVRDHYVHVAGRDAGGNTLFEGRSVRFGRMEKHAESLAPIQKVEIAPENYLLVNGKPFFNRGHMQMQQNFGPSAFAHKPINFKDYGFNTCGLGRRVNPDDAWKQGLYLVTTKIEPVPPMKDTTRTDVQQMISKPATIGINFIEWEGAPAGGTPEDNVKYAKDIKALLGGRPLWISAGWYSPTVNGIVHPCYLEHDMFAPENNSYLQPSQLDKEIGGKKRMRGERYVLNTYPNVFNDMPWPVQRFEHWTEIIRGHTGYTIIGIPGDNTLYRGMNGEIRFIEPILFSKEKPRDVTVSPRVEHIVRSLGGKTYVLATNAGPVIGGDWEWSTAIKDQGIASHTGDCLWNRFHPFMRDYHNHFFKDMQPVAVKKGDKIVQYVQIPSGAKVSTLVLMVRGNGDWMYQAVWGDFDHKEFTDSGVRCWLAKDMHQMFWGTIGFSGPEGSDPHNPNLMKFVFTPEQFHRIGALPEPKKWARLEVPVETIGLDGMLVDGFGFLSKGDRVWWERTLLVQDGKETELCDGSVGIHPEKLKAVRFSVPGLRAGTKVNVMFEEREIEAGDGYFDDDLSGEPGYQNLWVGIYGDKVGETGYYGDGVFYNYNWGKIAARLYEIP